MSKNKRTRRGDVVGQGTQKQGDQTQISCFRYIRFSQVFGAANEDGEPQDLDEDGMDEEEIRRKRVEFYEKQAAMEKKNAIEEVEEVGVEGVEGVEDFADEEEQQTNEEQTSQIEAVER